MNDRTAALFPDHFEESEQGPVPAGWKVSTLGDLSQKPQYGYTASAKSEPIGPMFLRIADINKQTWIDWESVPFCEISAQDYEKYKVEIGDIVVARMADPGHGVMIEEVFDAVFASYLIRFKLKDAEYDRYVQHWLRSTAYWELVMSRSAGTTRANLNAKVLSAFPVILPNHAVTSAFRKVVDSLRSRVVANVEQSRILAAIRDTLLPRLMSGDLQVPDAKQIVDEAMP
jgi:type I restriction enzyme S subunit